MEEDNSQAAEVPNPTENAQADEVPAATEDPSMEEITQADDIPPFTQDSQQYEPAHREDETRAMQLFEGGNVIENVEQENRALFSHFLATNATTSLGPPTQASHGGVAHMSRGMDFPRANIRALAPMSFHPNEFPPERGNYEVPSASVLVIKIGGKKYVTMANLQASMVQGSKNKKKSGKL